MGIRPVRKDSILARSLSTQTTSLPRSAKTAPVTSPTYPVPTTQIFKAQALQAPSGYQTPDPAGQSCRDCLDCRGEVREQEQGEPASLILGSAGELGCQPLRVS